MFERDNLGVIAEGIEFLLRGRNASTVPVLRVEIPSDDFVAHVSKVRQNLRVLRAHGWTDPLGFNAEDLLECSLETGHLSLLIGGA